jgi:ABC-type sugar transport system ATPase subunit
MNPNAFLRISHVSKTFPGVRALDDINLEVERGEIHALIGENGAGKSTLIKILSGVYQPNAGAEIFIDGKKIEAMTPLEALKKGIVVIYQDFSLFPNTSVAENIAITSDIGKGTKFLNWSTIRKTSHAALDRLGVDIDIDLPLGSLSVAKQQLVAIARALTYNARLLIMDEPTSALSKGEVELLFKIMRNLKESGISILFVSHKLDELFAISDRFSVLRDGKYLGTFGEDELDDDRLISLMVGRKIEYTIYPKRAPLTDKVLEVRDFNKAGNFKNVSFHVNRGEILGITGLVGAGRTEILKAIFGINRQDSGQLLLEGKEISISSAQDAVAHGIAYLPENRLSEGLVLRKSMADNIAVTVADRLTDRLGLIDRDKRRELVGKWIQTLNIKPAFPEMLATKLSGGNQQRVVLAKWLAVDPKVLLVDEPTNGIDVGAKAEIHKLLRDLAASGISIIMVSSELPEILAIADRVIVMRRGKISAEFDGATVTQEEIMNKAILGVKQQATR